MIRIFRIVLFCLVLIHSSLASLYAEEGFKLIESSNIPVNLSQHFTVFEDSSKLLKLDDVNSVLFTKKFVYKPSDGVALNFGYTKSVYWLRINFINDSERMIRRNIEIRASRISHIAFFHSEIDGNFKTIHTGSSLHFNSRPYHNRFFVFPIGIEPKSNMTVYFKMDSNAPIIIQPMLWDQVAFQKYERNDYFAQAWYFGMATAMILFNLLLFLSLRDFIYLIYVSFVVTFTLSLAASNGLVKEYIWQGESEYYNLSSSIGFSLTFVAVIFFMRRMISIRSILPKVDSILIFISGIHFFFILCSIFFYSNIAILAPFLFILTMFFLMGTGFYCAYLKHRPAYYFVLAFILLFFTGVINGLTSLGLLPAPSIRDNALQFGSAGEMLLLAFALADRYKIIQKEKQNAQRDVLESQKQTLLAEQKLVESLKISERLLEQKVSERTKELDHTLKILKHDLLVAKKIQENSLYVNPNLHDELTIIQTYIPLSEVGGDFYDICRPIANKYRIFQADATGHGVQAAMITMAIKGVYDNVKGFDLEPDRVMEIFNSEFIDKYASLQSLMTAMIIDIDVIERKIHFTSAGHPPAVLLNETGIHFLKTAGKIIGVNRETTYQTIQMDFNQGDRLYIYTDGVFEEFNMRLEEFGDTRFYSILELNKHRSIQETIDVVIQELYDFLEGVEKQDDFTIIGVEFK